MNWLEVRKLAILQDRNNSLVKFLPARFHHRLPFEANDLIVKREFLLAWENNIALLQVKCWVRKPSFQFWTSLDKIAKLYLRSVQRNNLGNPLLALRDLRLLGFPDKFKLLNVTALELYKPFESLFSVGELSISLVSICQ